MQALISAFSTKFLPDLKDQNEAEWPKGSLYFFISLSLGHQSFQGFCPSYHLIPKYTYLEASGTTDHPTLHLYIPFWAATPKGRCPVGHRGKNQVCPSICPSVRLSIHPSIHLSICSFHPYIPPKLCIE